MADYLVLYNPEAGNGKAGDAVKKITAKLPGDKVDSRDITDIKDYQGFFESLPADERIILCGGDGTINRFLNDTNGINVTQDIYYYPAGNGNDFANDIGKTADDKPFCINPYIEDLPTVTVKGKTYKFLNGIGYGIDGYCCEVGDKQKAESTKPVNYAGIAIKGLLFHYKPTNAIITVDGEKKEYKKVWLAPTMNGRFYGGGMMPTPDQNRLNRSHTVSTMVFHGAGKLKTLMIFPSIFKGEHIKKTKYVEVLTGHQIKVEFDRPTALQIDGETILGVTECEIETAKVPAKV